MGHAPQLKPPNETQTLPVGAVAIGRNEGERLGRCLRSLRASGATVVYVDSASRDGSVVLARSLGVEVVELSLDVPFTAGRARNTGFARLIELVPGVPFVQFVDGDCEVVEGWLEYAIQFLRAREGVAIVCGRRKERHPEHTVYNSLCDMEWNTSVGDTDACGGDFLVRTQAFAKIGGFHHAIIAGEEPELCYRLKRAGWQIHRVDRLMTLHDAAITKFSQWARRSCRSGYAYLARASLHLHDRTRYCWRENARIVLWAFALPLTTIVSIILVSPWFGLLALAYPLQFLRLRQTSANDGYGMSRDKYALFLILSKWPEFLGQLLFVYRLLRKRDQVIIEYK